MNKEIEYIKQKTHNINGYAFFDFFPPTGRINSLQMYKKNCVDAVYTIKIEPNS